MNACAKSIFQCALRARRKSRNQHRKNSIVKRQTINQSQSKDASGRGAAVICYGLMLGAIMTVVTALVAVVLALFWLPRSATWVRSHLWYQIFTVFWAIVGLGLGALAWGAFGVSGLPAQWAWGFGYLVFTCELTWLVARCAFGLYRLTHNQPAGCQYNSTGFSLL